MAVKINSLEFENVKRVKAVQLAPSENGLTIIGGKNGQGKTSVLDAIAWALGGERFRLDAAKRDGSLEEPHLYLTLSNGIVVERKGKNGALKVLDPEGKKAGQTLLDSFINSFALDLPKFLGASNKEKADILLQIIGVGDQLKIIEDTYKKQYVQRTEIGRIRDQKKKFAAEMPYYEEAPNDIISASELIAQQQEILAINGENARKREQAEKIAYELSRAEEQMRELEERMMKGRTIIEQLRSDLAIAHTDIEHLVDQSTEALEQNIRNIDQINIKVRSNMDKAKAESEAEEYAEQYKTLTESLESLQKEKMDLLNNANLPLPKLSVEDGELIYRGKKWNDMSGSEQLVVATAIVRKLMPHCGFVLMDKLEQMDVDTLKEFGAWAIDEGLQIIATRVSTGEECSVIIEDGYVQGTAPTAESPRFIAGTF